MDIGSRLTDPAESMGPDLEQVRRLVGDITATQLRYVDYALSMHVGVFTPIAGPCYYAISPAHTHPAFSFVVAFDGGTRVRFGDREVTCPAGQVCAMGPRVPHQEIPGDDPPRYVAIMISERFLQAQLRAYPGARLPSLEERFWPSSPELVRGVKEFLIEHDAGMPGRAALLEAHALRITHLILRMLLGLAGFSQRIARRMNINHAVEYLHAHLDAPVTVGQMARAAALSVSHFTREFRKEMGKSPKQYLLRVRLAQAKRLLMQGDANITEVALRTGFANAGHFSLAFRRAFGVTPSAFRGHLAE
jgi:AraC family transcriptional regulator